MPASQPGQHHRMAAQDEVPAVVGWTLIQQPRLRGLLPVRCTRRAHLRRPSGRNVTTHASTVAQPPATSRAGVCLFAAGCCCSVSRGISVKQPRAGGRPVECAASRYTFHATGPGRGGGTSLAADRLPAPQQGPARLTPGQRGQRRGPAGRRRRPGRSINASVGSAGRGSADRVQPGVQWGVRGGSCPDRIPRRARWCRPGH